MSSVANRCVLFIAFLVVGCENSGRSDTPKGGPEETSPVLESQTLHDFSISFAEAWETVDGVKADRNPYRFFGNTGGDWGRMGPDELRITWEADGVVSAQGVREWAGGFPDAIHDRILGTARADSQNTKAALEMIPAREFRERGLFDNAVAAYEAVLQCEVAPADRVRCLVSQSWLQDKLGDTDASHLHLKEASEVPLDMEAKADRRAYAELLHRQGVMAMCNDKFEEARSCLRNALMLRKEFKGIWRLDVPRTLLRLAGVQSKLGLPTEAETMLFEAKKIRDEILGPTHPDVIDALLQLGDFARHCGDLKQAETHYRNARNLFPDRCSNPMEALGVARAHGRIALALHDAGLPGADEFARRALPTLKQFHSDLRGKSLSTLESLAK